MQEINEMMERAKRFFETDSACIGYITSDYATFIHYDAAYAHAAQLEDQTIITRQQVETYFSDKGIDDIHIMADKYAQEKYSYNQGGRRIDAAMDFMEGWRQAILRNQNIAQFTDEEGLKWTDANKELYYKLIKEPNRLLKMYSQYSDLLTLADAVSFIDKECIPKNSGNSKLF